MVIEPIFEREFAPNSYGFRPGRGCKDALREVESHLKQGREYVVDIDIKGYFDAIPHDALMKLVKERISDSKVLGLMEAFLKQGVLEQGVEIEPEKGSPQGGLISPLLANIYLDPLDWILEQAGYASVRYADDIVALCASQNEASEVMEKISAWMEGAGLQLNKEKTRTVDMSGKEAYFDFLGYRFKRSKRGRLMRLVRPQSQKKLRGELRVPTKRSNGKSMSEIIAIVNPKLQGWYGYFKQADIGEHTKLDGWLRMRLRSVLRKRQKKKGRGRGSDHQRWPNRYFEELGLFSLEAARGKEMSLQ